MKESSTAKQVLEGKADGVKVKLQLLLHSTVPPHSPFYPWGEAHGHSPDESSHTRAVPHRQSGMEKWQWERCIQPYIKSWL